jgi:hypothetical protein
MNLLVFGDQVSGQYPLLRRACTWKNNATLTTFLDRVSVVIRDEVQKLPKTQRDRIPDFLTTWDLVEAYYSKGLRVAQLESCMVTIAQLAHYIGYVLFFLVAQLIGLTYTFQLFRGEPVRITKSYQHQSSWSLHWPACRLRHRICAILVRIAATRYRSCPDRVPRRIHRRRCQGRPYEHHKHGRELVHDRIRYS